jgi:hypothetical protein
MQDGEAPEAYRKRAWVRAGGLMKQVAGTGLTRRVASIGRSSWRDGRKQRGRGGEESGARRGRIKVREWDA